MKLSSVFLLVACPLVAGIECPLDVSDSIKATLDNGKIFETCTSTTQIHSLFDVLKLSQREFLHFCRSSECIKPVETLRQNIPTNCLITYHGSPRNISAEVSTLYNECAKVVGAADKTDEDYVYRYFLD
ncbi:hypothetical protein P3T76_009024 [Phytophthora citrophthora]|uniref:Elicitin n=1 Tax=Phytophthora citrophthora TaxID=4793 RepID=A0AAD9LKT4_9STRA|nr:hypothetical protein P3T76_009024 [Phytophthora citrophthora]